MEKIKNIEFLRVFLIWQVIILHMFINNNWCLCKIYPKIELYQNIKTLIAHSNNCVEGFFIIAGFLLVLTFKPQITIKEFIIKKYLRLSPVIAFSILVFFVLFLFGIYKFHFIANIVTILLLNSFGKKIAIGENIPLWYVSTLFFALLTYFSILKYISGKKQKIIIIFLIILGYGIIEALQQGSFANPTKNYYHILNIGSLRALGGVGTGILIGKIYQYFAPKIKKDTKIFYKIIFTIPELFSLSFLFWWTLCKHESINNIIFVINFVILLSCFVFKQGFISKIFDKYVWQFLGKYQYSVYVMHYVVLKTYGLTLWKTSPNFVNAHIIAPIIITILSMLAAGVFAYHFIEIPCANFLRQKWLEK